MYVPHNKSVASSIILNTNLYFMEDMWYLIINFVFNANEKTSR
jgi:hypothetical protein